MGRDRWTVLTMRFRLPASADRRGTVRGGVCMMLAALFGTTTCPGASQTALTGNEVPSPASSERHRLADPVTMPVDMQSLRTTYHEQRQWTWRADGGWTADRLRFAQIRFGDPDPGLPFRPQGNPFPEWPGMRMTWDYEALAAASRQRPAPGSLPLAAMGLLLLATRRWS